MLLTTLLRVLGSCFLGWAINVTYPPTPKKSDSSRFLLRNPMKSLEPRGREGVH